MKTCHVKSFTILELMIVVILIGLIAAFAIPNYTKSIERAHLRDAITQLQALHAANQIYRAQTGSYNNVSCGFSGGVTCINNAFGINLIENGMDYRYQFQTASSWFAVARRQPPAAQMRVRVTQAALSATNPTCIAQCP